MSLVLLMNLSTNLFNKETYFQCNCILQYYVDKYTRLFLEHQMLERRDVTATVSLLQPFKHLNESYSNNDDNKTQNTCCYLYFVLQFTTTMTATVQL